MRWNERSEYAGQFEKVGRGDRLSGISNEHDDWWRWWWEVVSRVLWRRAEKSVTEWPCALWWSSRGLSQAVFDSISNGKDVVFVNLSHLHLIQLRVDRQCGVRRVFREEDRFDRPAGRASKKSVNVRLGGRDSERGSRSTIEQRVHKHDQTKKEKESEELSGGNVTRR